MVTIETERLILRPLTLDDQAALLAVWGNAEAMRWFPHPLTSEEMAEGILRQQSRYPSGTGLLGLVLKLTGELIGDCGPVWQDVDDVEELEIGYHLRPDHWNRGLATEAAAAVLAYARQSFGRDDCISLIRPENLPSRRVAEKNGAAFEKNVCWHGYDHCVYRYQKKRHEDC